MMQTPPFALYSPDSVESALDLVREFQERGEEFDWISGGTDLLPNYKWHLNTKPHVISLAKIEELHTLNATHIGAMVRLHDLSNNNSTHPLLRKAASSVASVMIRRSATVGGNICLDTRCFWFNQSEDWRESIDWCYKCDCGTGSDCRVIPNQNTLCVATYQADLAPNLMCLGAKIHLASPDGMREMDLSEFFELDGIKRNVLQPSEFVTHITLPNNSIDFDGDYLKLTQRESWDFPEVGIAVAWKLENNKISELRLASTGLEAIPRLHSEEGQTALLDWNGEESVNGLSEAIRKAIKPVNNTQFQPSYRRKMVRILTQRCLKSLKDLSAAD